MKVATISGSDVILKKSVVTGIVALIAAVVPLITVFTTTWLDRGKARQEGQVSERAHEQALQAAELQRLQLIMALETPEDRANSLRLLVHAGLLRDKNGKLIGLEPTLLPQWPDGAAPAVRGDEKIGVSARTPQIVAKPPE